MKIITLYKPLVPFLIIILLIILAPFFGYYGEQIWLSVIYTYVFVIIIFMYQYIPIILTMVLSMLIDSIYSLCFGTSFLIFASFFISNIFRIKKLKNPGFLLFYFIYAIVCTSITIIIAICRYFSDFNFINLLIYIISSMVVFPIIYYISKESYKKLILK